MTEKRRGGSEAASLVAMAAEPPEPNGKGTRYRLAVTPSQRAAVQMGRRIRDARQEMGLTLSAVAGKDFSRSFLNQVELGMARPSVRNLQIIADRLNRPIEYFLQDDELSRTALELALTESETRLRRGDGSGARELVEKLGRHSLLSEETKIRVTLILAESWIRERDPEKAIPLLLRAIAVCEKRKWNLFLVDLYDRMGTTQYLLRRLVEAGRWFDKAFATYHSCHVKDPLLEARVLGHRANIHYVSGHPEDAIVGYQAAIETAGDVLDMQGIAGIYEGLAMAFQKAGRPDRSLQYAQRSLRLYETLNDIRMSAQLRNNMACILLEQARPEEAEALFLEGAGQLRRVGDKETLPHLLAGAAEAALDRGDLSRARSRLSTAERAASSSTDVTAHLYIERVTARLVYAEGNLDEARLHFEKALQLAGEVSSVVDQVRVTYDYARVLEAAGQHREAAGLYRKAFEARRASS